MWLVKWSQLVVISPDGGRQRPPRYERRALWMDLLDLMYDGLDVSMTYELRIAADWINDPESLDDWVRERSDP